VNDTASLETIAVLGGTGQEGSGLAARWAKAGHPIVIGSRDAEKARRAAAEMAARIPGARISGDGLAEAAAAGTVVVLSVPYAAQLATLDQVAPALQGKVLIDVTVPLVPPRVSRVTLPEADSAVVAAQAKLGPGVRVVSAFQNVSAHKLADLAAEVECDVLVCGDDEAARGVAVRLAEAAGMRGLHAGPLANSVAAEALTSVLIFMNRRYKSGGAGIRITALPDPSP